MFFRRANKNKGSFLLEALIAVSILSVSLATLLLEREMIEVVENGYIERDISQERNLEKPYERFTLFIKTAAAGKEYVFDSLNEVQLTLSWEEGRKAHQFSVSTFIFNSL
jgi:hypothetical protein